MQTQTEFLQLRSHLEQVIVGQSALLDRLMIALLTGGHILLESATPLVSCLHRYPYGVGIRASMCSNLPTVTADE